MKPQMFIGSSVEGLPIANALQTNLQYEVDSTIWSQGVFALAETAMQSLLKQAALADFATFVLSPDDVTKLRQSAYKTARDNVILELGLFAGALGAGRVFFVIPNDPDFHLPTDLHGITAAKYTPGSHRGNMTAGLGAASNQILESIRILVRPGREYTNLNGLWRGVWYCNRPSYPPANEFTATITHIGDSIRAKFESNGEFYPIEGTIHRGSLITGMWGKPDAGATFFGPFQLVIAPSGKLLRGRWSGFTHDYEVDSGIVEWKREG